MPPMPPRLLRMVMVNVVQKSLCHILNINAICLCSKRIPIGRLNYVDSNAITSLVGNGVIELCVFVACLHRKRVQFCRLALVNINASS